MMELSAREIYPIKVAPEHRKGILLLAPYDLVITIGGGARLEIGRFSIGLLSHIRIVVDEPDLLLRAGSFCQIASESLILLGGQHHDSSLFNYSMGNVSTMIYRHFMEPEDRSLIGVRQPQCTELGDNILIYTGSLILPEAKIGTGSIIAAGAVVASDLSPALGIYGGVPARRIRDRFPPHLAELYQEVRLAEVMAHDLPKIPRLLSRLEGGELTIKQYRDAVSFLPGRPAVHLDATAAFDTHTINLGKITGYSIGGHPISDQKRELLDAYFSQISTPDTDSQMGSRYFRSHRPLCRCGRVARCLIDCG